MSRLGLIAAKLYGKKLTHFVNQLEAEKYFDEYRTRCLSILEKTSKKTNDFVMNYTPESLKKLESWYFEIYKNNQFQELKVERDDFERSVAVYFGEVAIKNNENAKWIVSEFPFEKGKYNLGINEGFCTLMIPTMCSDLFKEPNNNMKQSLYRKYKKYFMTQGKS